ncbi:MAG: nucleotidyltransferase family protein [Candidatus Electrothrix aestuarii]|uniref:Nucleotidyltransferase family protein n=1 Tax=Candidatus Electrothrix aestuarii TaxID=3062594 RepID=A0AAU8LSM7_9BACT|nr:nucleotidyltransferase family protein [Candidatus Electrothrix aestuarii]
MTVRGLHPESATLIRQIFHDQEVLWPENNTFSEDIFFQDIVSQGMAPLLYQRLAAKRKTSWPQSLFLRLQQTALRQAAVEVVLESDLGQLLACLADIGVAPLLLKGTPLSYTLYPEPGLRPRCDTDLFIPETDREKTSALLKKMGYAPLHEAQVDSINSQMSYARKTAQGITCRYDLHWQVSNCNSRFSRDFIEGKLFECAEAVSALGENARTLNKVDALIFACFHRAGHFSHSGDRLIWLYDIHLLCQALTAKEGTRFHQRAKELQIISLCIDAIKTTQSWFGTVCSQELRNVLQEQAEHETAAFLLGKDRKEGIKKHALLELQGLTWTQGCSYIVQNLFPPPDFMLWRYQKEKKIILPWLYARRFAEAVGIVLRR